MSRGTFLVVSIIQITFMGIIIMNYYGIIMHYTSYVFYKL